jgi:hypothetical protein
MIQKARKHTIYQGLKFKNTKSVETYFELELKNFKFFLTQKAGLLSQNIVFFLNVG